MKEVREFTAIDRVLTFAPPFEQVAPPLVEILVQVNNKTNGFGTENFLAARRYDGFNRSRVELRTWGTHWVALLSKNGRSRIVVSNTATDVISNIRFCSEESRRPVSARAVRA